MAEVALVRLTKQYGHKTVVDAVDIAVRDGELLCVIGPSGCGKSTTLGLSPASSRPARARCIWRAAPVVGRRLPAAGAAEHADHLPEGRSGRI